MFKRFLRDESGATAIEYTLIGATMSILIVTLWPILTAGMKTDISNIAGYLASYK